MKSDCSGVSSSVPPEDVSISGQEVAGEPQGGKNMVVWLVMRGDGMDPALHMFECCHSGQARGVPEG